MFQPGTLIFIAVVIAITIALLVYFLVFNDETKVVETFVAIPRSEFVRGGLTGGANMRFTGTCLDGGYAGSQSDCGSGFVSSKSKFLGRPEAPIFYNIGDTSETRNYLTKAAKENAASGFRSRRQQVVNLSPY